MPKVNLLISKDKHKKLTVLLNGYKDIENKNRDDLGKVIGMSGRAVHDYMKDPGTMRLDHFLKIARYLNIPIEELRECIRY